MSETTTTNAMESIEALGMGRPWRQALLAIAILLQLVIPIRTVLQHESAVTSGNTYRFRTRIVDPYDAFRGRYVQLGFEENELRIADLDPLPESGDRIYARLETGEDGFARLSEASLSPPDEGDYLRVDVRWVGTGDSIARVDLPFDRYYMNEDAAPEAEEIYRDSLDRGSAGDEDRQDEDRRTDAGDEPDDGNYVLVRVDRGIAVIEALYVGDRPIEDWITDPSNEPIRW